MSSGRFIVLEGPDGSGTTMHVALLAEHLRSEGADAVQTCEPTDGAIGRFIREHLKKQTLTPEALQLLFTADRIEHLHKEVLPALNRGATVISDRYWLSTVVYGEALGIDTDGLEYLNRKMRQPDVQIVLLPPFETCQERLGRRAEKDILEGDSLQMRVYNAYTKRAKAEHIPVVDSSGSIDATGEMIAALVL